ncbi:hypothetical protein [Burkholderia pseudomallei]|uniref:hypothetical protein n=1 Tax=Burkholderia pseudomallei TaxID=28450 RepID=UPI0003D87FC7|nr:hypothetical protein [Burkholderia pseudomallei]AHE35033.1 hypothetical protein BBS_1353 [Burkholderia pseudomallei NAU20B-16]AHG34988.1 hypothetical protein BBQ_3286 [Burkholderia pseudomallei MSHR511]AHG67295.1 hypothetical protein BBN_3408 [Burkholderia pseudomallei MSHR146]AIV61097.1 hypothetical protein Y044_1610 [Burkholderia pseudomallei MSHR2243]AIV72618.1 hypothetical protein Y028_1016 [Burkholderia pseudomallei MSHR62]
MANDKPNKGRRLRLAVSRFAAMLIQEAKHIGQLSSYRAVDEALDLPYGQSFRYAQYPVGAKTRAPQVAWIQELENRVAKLLKRTAHTVIVENNLIREEMGIPSELTNPRDFSGDNFQLGYEGDWPTYRRLICPEPDLIEMYYWQWGVLWDRGLPLLSREEWGVPADSPIEPFVDALTHDKMRARAKVEELVGNRYRWGEAPDIDPSDVLLEWDFADTVDFLERVGGDVLLFWQRATGGTAGIVPESPRYLELSLEGM